MEEACRYHALKARQSERHGSYACGLRVTLPSSDSRIYQEHRVLIIMVKTLEFKDYFDFAGPEMVFKMLYEDDSFIKFYHKEVNRDANAQATVWTEKEGGSHRVVTFKPDIANVPLFLRGWLGSDIAPVMELQQYTRAGSTITIHSELTANLVWGFTLITVGDTILSPLEGGCEIVVKLTIELQTTWTILQDKLENDVEKEAENAFKRWLNKARVFCEGKIGKGVKPLLEREDSIYHDAEELDVEEASSPVDHAYGPRSSLIVVRSPGRQVAWKRFCFTIWNQMAREILVLRHSSSSVKHWTTLGLGIAAGLTLGLLYSRYLKKVL